MNSRHMGSILVDPTESSERILRLESDLLWGRGTKQLLLVTLGSAVMGTRKQIRSFLVMNGFRPKPTIARSNNEPDHRVGAPRAPWQVAACQRQRRVGAAARCCGTRFEGQAKRARAGAAYGTSDDVT
jgi:hypothetical protein